MPTLDLDTIDCRILAALQAEGRLSNVELAERVGLSPSPCLRRVQRLERDGYIEAYRAVLGRRRIGLGFTVFIGVKIDAHADERADEMRDTIVAMPGWSPATWSRARPITCSRSWSPISSITSVFSSIGCWP